MTIYNKVEQKKGPQTLIFTQSKSVQPAVLFGKVSKGKSSESHRMHEATTNSARTKLTMAHINSPRLRSSIVES